MKAVIFCIALLVMLVPTAKAISVSPSKYYYGETVTFNFTYTKVSLLPNDEKLKYQVSNETPKLLGTNYLVSGLKIICNNVRIEEPESVEKVKILDTVPHHLKSLF